MNKALDVSDIAEQFADVGEDLVVTLSNTIKEKSLEIFTNTTPAMQGLVYGHIASWLMAECLLVLKKSGFEGLEGQFLKDCVESAKDMMKTAYSKAQH